MLIRVHAPLRRADSGLRPLNDTGYLTQGGSRHWEHGFGVDEQCRAKGTIIIVFLYVVSDVRT